MLTTILRNAFEFETPAFPVEKVEAFDAITGAPIAEGIHIKNLIT